PLRPVRAQGSTGFGHGRGDRSRSRATSVQSGRIPTHEPERRRRLSLRAARAGPPASSRPSPPRGPSRRLPSPSASLCRVLTCTAGSRVAHLRVLPGYGLARRKRGLDVARMAALAAVLEPRTAARHVRVDDRDLVVDTVVGRARDAKTAGRRAREHLDQRFQRARERLNLTLAAYGWRTMRIGAVRDPE